MSIISHPRSFLLLSIAALAACAAPQSRVETGLIRAGVSPRMAGCMADRMVDRLSITQLRRLQSLAKVSRADPRDLSIDQLLHNIRALEDPETVGVTSKAALVCALGG